MITSEERAELAALLKSKSVQRGRTFTLASGQQSDIYVDAKLTTCTAKGTKLVGRAFLSEIAAAGWKPQAIGGLAIGADPIVMAVARESLEFGAPVDAFLVRKEPKKHGMQRHLEGIAQPEGVRVVIVDDVCTTGDSTVAAVEHARDAGMEVLGAVCLVDRESGARENLEGKLKCPFRSVFTLSQLAE